jgi:hypothetical protein
LDLSCVSLTFYLLPSFLFKSKGAKDKSHASSIPSARVDICTHNRKDSHLYTRIWSWLTRVTCHWNA